MFLSRANAVQFGKIFWLTLPTLLFYEENLMAGIFQTPWLLRRTLQAHIRITVTQNVPISSQSTMVFFWKSTNPCLCSKLSHFKTSWQILKVKKQLSPLTHLYHIWELSNMVLEDPVPKGVSKIQQIKVESSTFIK